MSWTSLLNLKVPELFCTIYMISIFLTTIIFYFIIPETTIHGRTTRGISKIYYAILYFTSVLILRGHSSPFIIHTLRRLIETLLYCRNSKSKMSIIHLIHGEIYFIIISNYLKDKYIEYIGFVAANLVQLIAHYRVYHLKKQEFSHYYAEILIYGYIYYCVPTPAMFWNLMYILAFVYVSIKNRHLVNERLAKNNK